MGTFGGIPIESKVTSGGGTFGGIPIEAEPTHQAIPIASTASISATPEPSGISGKLSRWAQNVADDIRYGTDLTGVGTVLKHLGAHGVYEGEPHAVGEFMASLPLGLLRATKGAGEVGQGQLLQGGKDIAAGGLQAVQMPGSFVSPDIAGGATEAIDKFIPSASRAGENFSQIMGVAKDIPIDVRMPGDVALNIQKLSESGASRPKVISDFLKRVTDPNKGPLTYEEARNFYSNATRLSADENMRLTPIMKRQVGAFTSALNDAITGAAAQAGKASQYTDAMTEYHRAMQLRALGDKAKDILTNKMAQTAAAAGAGAAGAYAVKELLK
jgi:hypothetical protein